MTPFRKGLLQNVALCNYRIGILHLFKAAGPLLLGTILEYGEWNLLTLFIYHLGPAEGKFPCIHCHFRAFIVIFWSTNSLTF